MHERRLSPEPSVPLHIHTFYTFLGAISPPELLVRTAKEFGYPALALTDTKNFYGLGRFFTACNKYGVKPIPGVELPLSLGLQGKTDATFLAQDNDGLLDLFSWVTKAKRDGRLLEIDDIEKRKGRVVVLVRGPFGLIREALELDNFFYAIDGPSTSQRSNASMIEGVMPGKPVVAHDVRMASLEQVNLFKLMLRLAKERGSPHAVDYERILNHGLMKPLGLWFHYNNSPAWLARTREIAQDSHVIPTEAPKIRAKTAPEGIDSGTYLEYLVWGKLSQIPEGETLINRVSQELSIIKVLGFADYLLICYEIAQFCRNRSIEFTVTGSGNNSLVLNVLGMTRVDARDLLFERFLNPSRADLPDVDFDIPYDRKKEVIQFLLDNYEQASQLAVVKHLRERGVVQLAEQHGITLTPHQAQELVKANLPFGVATHPSGVIYADSPPQERIQENIIAQLDRDAVKTFNLPKIDVLSNVGLTKIGWARRYLAQDGVEVGTIPQDEERVLSQLFSGNTIGIANVESPHLRNLLKTIGGIVEKPRFDHLVQVLALARPAASTRSSYFTWASGKVYQTENPRIDAILGRTGGSLIFQEQVLRLGREVAGLSWEEADKLRKLTSETISSQELKNLRESFINGCLTNNLAQERAEYLFSQIESFRNYGFIEGHARSLAKMSYECAWLEEKFPVHFWTAVVNTASDGQGLYPLQAYINETLRRDISFYFPPLEEVEKYAKPHKNAIAIGMKLVKDQENFGMEYSRFLQFLYEGLAERNPVRLVRSQLELFNVAFTNNPMYLIPERYHFKPREESAEIVGLPILVSVREDFDLAFVTLDSARIVDLVIPLPLFRRKSKNLHSRFWRLKIRTEAQKIEATDILAPPVI